MFSFAKCKTIKHGVVSHVQTSSNVQDPNSLVLFQLCPNIGFFVPKKPNKCKWYRQASKIYCIQIFASFNQHHLHDLFWSSHQSQSWCRTSWLRILQLYDVSVSLYKLSRVPWQRKCLSPRGDAKATSNALSGCLRTLIVKSISNLGVITYWSRV